MLCWQRSIKWEGCLFQQSNMDERNQVWMKDIKNNIKTWIYILCSWRKESLLWKWVMLPNAICRFIETSIKLPMAFFHSRTTTTKKSQFICKLERPRLTKAVLRKNNGAGWINLSDFRLYYKAPIIKKSWYWHKNRNINHWKKIASPEINPCTYWVPYFL